MSTGKETNFLHKVCSLCWLIQLKAPGHKLKEDLLEKAATINHKSKVGNYARGKNRRYEETGLLEDPE